MRSINNLIYFNNNRHTAIDPRVQEEMENIRHNKSASDISEVTRKARLKVAGILNCRSNEVFFTSGTTESLKLGIHSIFRNGKGKKHIVTSVTEHPVVLESCNELETAGAIITRIKVDREGLVDLDELYAVVNKDTLFVSIMAANNETGVIQPVQKIAEICQRQQVPFFCDTSQYVSKIMCDVEESGFDFLAFGAHKMYGPDNIGVLFIKEKYQAVFFADFVEKEFPADLLAGMGKCAELAQQELWEINTHVSKLKNHFEHQLLEISGLRINGNTRNRLYNTSNLFIPESVNVKNLLQTFDFAHNQKTPSHVLKAMGLSDSENQNSYRFSFGKYNTLEEVNLFLQEIFQLKSS